MNSGAILRLGRIPKEIKGRMVDFGAVLRRAILYEFVVHLKHFVWKLRCICIFLYRGGFGEITVRTAGDCGDLAQLGRDQAAGPNSTISLIFAWEGSEQAKSNNHVMHKKSIQSRANPLGPGHTLLLLSL